MTCNRCAYAPCSAPLRPNGPSPWWCGDRCMQAWTAAYHRTQQMPATFPGLVGDPPPAVLLPVRVDDGTRPLPDLPAAAYPPDAVPLAPAPVNRTGWLGRILGARSIGIARGGDRR